MKICRGTWFKGSISETKWTPISEEESLKIEDSHQMLWKSIVSYLKRQDCITIITMYCIHLIFMLKGITPGMHKVNENKEPTTTINPEIKSGKCKTNLNVNA